MLDKKLKELYNVDTISQDKGWKKVMDAVESLGEAVNIDFTGINVVDPWECPSFKQLIQKPEVGMKFTNSLQLVNKIKMMCILDSTDPDRIVNVEVEIPKEKTPEERKIEHNGKELIPQFKVEGDTAFFDATVRYSQMHSTNTLNSVDYAIRELIKTNNIKHVVIKIGKLSILDNVVDMLAEMIIDYEQMGIKMEVDLESPEAIKNLKLFMHKYTNAAYNTKGKIEAIEKFLAKNTAGMLIKYKKSRAVDDFGRHGKGEVVSSRIALFKGLEYSKKTNGVVAKIQSFNDKYFYTKQQWMVEHDNEIPNDLHSETIEITMDELGYGDLFLGTSYHFIEPIQQDISENKNVIIDIDDNQRNVNKSCTIPERIKVVFDDWGIEYNVEKLDEAIEKTKAILESKSKENQ